jgi:hypothetical protein
MHRVKQEALERRSYGRLIIMNVHFCIVIDKRISIIDRGEHQNKARQEYRSAMSKQIEKLAARYVYRAHIHFLALSTFLVKEHCRFIDQILRRPGK